MVYTFKNMPPLCLKLWHKVFDSLLPRRCVLCGGPAVEVCLCWPCKMDLPWCMSQCHQCGLRLPAAMGRAGELVNCGQCITNPPTYDHVASPLQYLFPADQLLKGLKFRRELVAGRVLSQLLCEHIQAEGLDLPDMLIPVPLHYSRMMKRGFNQAYELATHISRELGVPLSYSRLRRTRNTRAQSGLNRKQRQQNLRGAFYWHGSLPAARHVAIIDDVMTTGTTASECARVLKKAGSTQVDVWVPCRAIRPNSAESDQKVSPSVHDHTIRH